MVSFWVYDVAFMIIFSALVTWFLTTRKKDLSREGIIFMYRTKFGIKAIKYIGDNFKKVLHKMKGLVIGLGFVLMAAMMWMLGTTVATYILHPEITKLIKAPPIAPLIPYFPKLFGMESFFPPFYFTYFIVALAVVAIVHEFSHGIFMRTFGIKIKATGMVFLGPILGAFVEQDDKSMKSKNKLEQMTVLGAGVFANMVFALIFYGLYVGFFFTSFAASGYIFNSYGMTTVPLQNITGFSNMTNNMTLVSTTAGNFYLDESLATQLIEDNGEYLVAYIEAPAVLAQMRGAIIQADDVKILGQETLREFLENKNPGDKVTFTTEDSVGINEYEIILGVHPQNPTKAYLGVGHNVMQAKGIVQGFLSRFMSFKESSTLYKPTWDGEFVYFIYHLFWWVMIINLLVAMFNMMPLGMLDGGRFFYLAIAGIFKSERVAKRASKAMAYLIGLAFALMMIYWAIARF
ncbi:site-2 protease family protein [Candidatus Pacearchaeota archaeon]|nr:site-2 protease family protein [Candidatus Pacearchaeota archaeon]